MKKTITSPNAPKPAPFFSHGVLHNAKYTMEVAGQIGLDPAVGKVVEGGMAAETKQTLKNIGAILAEVGWSYKNITKMRIFITDMKEYAAMNEVYAQYFSEDAPARAAVAVKELPLGALVEMECVAVGEEINS